MQERAEKTGVLRVISPAWIPKVEIPGLHSSTKLCLQFPIFEHDLQRYHTLPVAFSIHRVIQRNPTNVDSLIFLALDVSAFNSSFHILHDNRSTSTVDKHTGLTN